jgi:hypothetical protein
MTITRWTNNQNQSPDTGEFEHIIELAIWCDCGITEYIGVTDATKNELVDLLANEVNQLRAWMDAEVESGSLDERTDEPQIARILQRPESDDDGDFPAICDWPVFFDWN